MPWLVFRCLECRKLFKGLRGGGFVKCPYCSGPVVRSDVTERTLAEHERAESMR